MRVLKIIGRYTWRLMAVWITGLFLYAVDLVGGVEKLLPGFEPPSWLYGAIFWLLLVVANARLYIEQELAKQSLEDRIAALKATEADIRINVQQDPELVIDQDSIDKRGLPSRATIHTQLEFENIGYKPGKLEWALDRAEARLPSSLRLDPDNDGEFDPRLVSMDGQKRAHKWLKIPLQVTARSPHGFARALNSVEPYSVVIRCHTKRIGGFSSEQRLIIQVTLQETRREMRDFLKKRGFDDLVGLIDSH